VRLRFDLPLGFDAAAPAAARAEAELDPGAPWGEIARAVRSGADRAGGRLSSASPSHQPMMAWGSPPTGRVSAQKGEVGV
jgi:hypothetical protein